MARHDSSSAVSSVLSAWARIVDSDTALGTLLGRFSLAGCRSAARRLSARKGLRVPSSSLCSSSCATAATCSIFCSCSANDSSSAGFMPGRASERPPVCAMVTPSIAAAPDAAREDASRRLCGSSRMPALNVRVSTCRPERSSPVASSTRLSVSNVGRCEAPRATSRLVPCGERTKDAARHAIGLASFACAVMKRSEKAGRAAVLISADGFLGVAEPAAPVACCHTCSRPSSASASTWTILSDVDTTSSWIGCVSTTSEATAACTSEGDSLARSQTLTKRSCSANDTNSSGESPPTGRRPLMVDAWPMNFFTSFLLARSQTLIWCLAVSK
eukprot:Unigene1029_Nuclearia_a/m.3282 Unigene1029_Nuclearia_a/g.3282  ORF Unigene1029_Nuclearia_a/g.3282 Unigene1029_Nuclearia_a/m.3282 type:complete len:330 (+) Unigene1029_Nuclearia_a:713-1702(+)